MNMDAILIKITGKLFNWNPKKKPRVNPKQRKREVKFCDQALVRCIPLTKRWAVRYTDLEIEFTFGAKQRRIFIAYNKHRNIYCSLPPPNKKETMDELISDMEWECQLYKTEFKLAPPTSREVTQLLQIFVLAYWCKVEFVLCPIVITLRNHKINLGPEDFISPPEPKYIKVMPLH